ncbi:AraC family transcriptional regulator [Paenibacillus sp. GYB003]|uniref:AraC family transcriptional regulator n=1 Tax=Paenibacillus sp. GYB003 TaxID=2994392 RepID=UPI002F96198F
MKVEEFLWDVTVDVFGAWLHNFPDNWFFTDRKNPHFRLWVLLQGNIVADCRGERYQVRAGDVVLWPAAESVHFANKGGGEIQLLSVLFTLQSRTGFRYQDLPGVPIFLSGLDMPLVEAGMRAIAKEMGGRKLGYKMSANGKLQEMLVHILRAGNYRKPKKAEKWIDAGHKSYLLGQIVSLLQEQPARFPTTQEMAEIVSVSEVHLRRLFQKVYMISPNRFVRQFKIRESIHLLRDTSLSISEIAYSLGFESPNYFSKVFHQETGCSPSDFRRLLRDREL